jgi:uncharacterized phage infection (PIP) family protein YhgE
MTPTEPTHDIELDEKLSENVKAGFATLDQGLQTVQQALGQIQSGAGKLDLSLVDQLGSTVLGAGNSAIDNVQGKLEQALQQVQSIKSGL